MWGPKNKYYKNRYKKADVEDVDKKIRNINCQYTTERRKYKKMKKSGAGKYFNSKWFGYELLSYLQDKSRPRKSLQAGFSRETT